MSIINKVAGGLANITTYDANTGAIIDITVSGNVTAAYIIGDGSNLSNIDAGNLVGAYGNANVAAYLPTYTGAISANRANVTGNVLGANFIGNGQYLSNINIANIAGSYANSNVANYLPINLSNINANNITTLGNVSVGKVGDSRNLQNYTATGTRITFDFTGIAPGIPFSIGETVFVSGTGVTGLDGTYIVTNCYSYAVEVASTFAAGTGIVTFGASVTSTNLKNASISGNLIAATVSSNGTLSVSGLSTLATVNATGNIRAANFIGNGQYLSNINIANIAGSYSNSNVASYLPNNTSNISGNVITGNLFFGDGFGLSNIPYANITNAYSNVNVASYLPNNTSNISGNVITGNLLNVNGPAFVAGNLTVSGNVNYTDVTDLVVGDPLIFVGANNVSDIVDLGMIVTFDDGVAQHGGFVRDASDGVWKLFSNVIPEPNTVVDFSNAIYDTLQAGFFLGDGGLLSNINAGNLVGAYSNANVANYLPTFTGTLTAGNANVTGNIIASNFIGNGQYLSNINIANIAGSYSNSNVASYLPNNTSNISGNVITGNLFFGNGFGLSNIPYANITNAYSNANVAFYLPNNTSNISGNVITGNLFSGNGSQLTNLPIASIIGNGTSNVRIPTANGNITMTVNAASAFNLSATSVGVGVGAGGFAQSQFGVAIGENAGQNSQGDGGIAIGAAAGQETQGSGAIAIGLSGTAGNTQGASAIAIGQGTAYDNQGERAIAIGEQAAYDIQGADAIAIGSYSGYSIQGIGAVAVGNYAGHFVQGEYSIAIGTLAGNSSQANNSIILNATGNDLDANNSGFYAAPVRDNVTTDAVFYDVTTNEISYATAYGNANVADYLPINTSSVNADVVTATLFSGDGGLLSNINAGNLVGAYGNANVADYLANNATSGDIYGGIITGTYLYGDGSNLTNIDGSTIFGDINISPNNITAGNATFNGNISVAGNVTVSGNLNYQDVTDLVVGDPLIYIGANNTADIVDLGLVASYDPGAGELHTGFVRDHTDGIWKLFTALADEPTTVVNWANATLAAMEVGTIIGDGGFLSNIQYANVVGAYSNTNVADYLPLNTANVNADVVTATLFSGDGGGLSNIIAANLVGAYANANVADYLPTYTGNLAGNNITITNSSNLGAIGNIKISGGVAGQFITTDGTGNLSFGDPISAVPAIYFTANANGNNQTFSNIYLSTFAANTDITLFFNGALLENTYYSLSGSTLTINTPLTVDDSICISQQFVSNANPVTMIPRSNDITSASSITPNVEYADQYDLLALAVSLTINAPVGSIQNAQRLTIRIKDNGSSQSLSWNAIYREIGTSLPSTTVAGKVLYVGCIYNSQDNTWDVVSVAIQA
jgi:hypothetical protein